MLDFLYLALVVAPLTIAAAAMLLIALRSYRAHADARAERRLAEIERAQDRPVGLRRPSSPMVEPPSIASLGDVRAIGRSVVASLANDPRPARPAAAAPAPAPAPSDDPLDLGPSLEELSALVESLAWPPRETRRPTAMVDVKATETPRVGAPAASTKHCPDCAEEVLVAARVCKHCRYRFDEPDGRRVSV